MTKPKGGKRPLKLAVYKPEKPKPYVPSHPFSKLVYSEYDGVTLVPLSYKDVMCRMPHAGECVGTTSEAVSGDDSEDYWDK